MKKMYFKLLCTLFVAACSTLQAAEQHNGVITIQNAVKNPQCICYNSLNDILIGGSNGFQLVDKNGKSKSKWGIRDGLAEGPFYQILVGQTCWYAIQPGIGNKSWIAHYIDTTSIKVTWSIPLFHNNLYNRPYCWTNDDPYPCAENNQNILYHHQKTATMPDILLHPHPYQTIMPLDYSQIKYHSLAMGIQNNVYILAILTHDNSIQFWLNRTDKPEFLYAQGLKKTEKLDESTEISQRLAFSPNGLSIAVALKNKCFIIPVLLQSMQEKTVCQLLFMLTSAQQ